MIEKFSSVWEKMLENRRVGDFFDSHFRKLKDWKKYPKLCENVQLSSKIVLKGLWPFDVNICFDIKLSVNNNNIINNILTLGTIR